MDGTNKDPSQDKITVCQHFSYMVMQKYLFIAKKHQNR